MTQIFSNARQVLYPASLLCKTESKCDLRQNTLAFLDQKSSLVLNRPYV